MAFFRRFLSVTDRPDLPEPVQPRVLVVAHNPVIPWEGERHLHQILQGKDPRRLAQQFIKAVRYASHGYVNYKIVEWLDTGEFPLQEDGFFYDAATYLFRWRSGTGFHFPAKMNYRHLLQTLHILPRINLNRIDEVWLFGYPHVGYEPSLMVGPEAFPCQSTPLSEGIGRCQRRFIIMGFDYTQDIVAMLRNLGHRSEAIMAHVYRHRWGKANLWQRFSRYDKILAGQAECGNIEFAPNSDQSRDFDNPRWIMSRCDDWYQFPHLQGETRRINCQEWGNGDPGKHHLWWFRHIPHVAGTSAGIANNWWSYIVDPEQVG